MESGEGDEGFQKSKGRARTTYSRLGKTDRIGDMKRVTYPLCASFSLCAKGEEKQDLLTS